MKNFSVKVSVTVITTAIVFVVIMAMVVRAQGPETKPYVEGQGAQATGRLEGVVSQEMRPGEGLAGSSGTGRLSEAGSSGVAAASLNILYRFSGATDDGEQGSGSRREATSVLCTNIDDTHNVQVEVQIIQWNGTDVYTGSVNMPPNRSYTYSTQNTTIYFDDVILGGSPGTPAIYQGSGRILSSNPNVICTVEVLDPLNYPPVFVSAVELFKQ
jgi:hypothetical protein